jgi:hypothetical protein
MTGRFRPKHDDGDDDNLPDERGVLEDGRTFRMPMYLMDHVQRAIAQDGHETGRDRLLRDTTRPRPIVVDEFGNAGAALRGPGPCYLTGALPEAAAARLHARDQAYQQHDAEEARRWQGSDHDREIPLKHITGDARMDAYLARHEYDTNAWRQDK